MKAPDSIDLRDYLLARGWELAILERRFALTHPRFSRRQLVFPVDREVPDYDEAIDWILDKLADLEERPKAAILADIESLRSDVVRFRLLARQETEGIPLSFAISTISGSQQVLLAAAHMVLRPQLYHKRLGRSEALRLVDQARFGHTEPGSFVLRVECPLDESPSNHTKRSQSLAPADAPFVRRTTAALREAACLLVEAIETARIGPFIDHLRRSSSPELSANLCEGLGRFFAPDLENSLELSFRWAAISPACRSSHDDKPVLLQSSYFPFINEVREAIKPRESESIETYIGTVEELSGEMTAAGLRAGEVEVALLLPEGETVRALVELSAEQYLAAMKAHRTHGAYVMLRGRLLPGRQPRNLIELTSFEAILDPASPKD